ncbi:MAG: hypothetical protein ABEI96_08945 [Haloarculaceae archaeon]
MSTTEQVEQTEWAELRGLARIIALWILATVVVAALLLVFRTTLF